MGFLQISFYRKHWPDDLFLACILAVFFTSCGLIYLSAALIAISSFDIESVLKDLHVMENRWSRIRAVPYNLVRRDPVQIRPERNL
jgi:hypothetical protein